MGKSNGYDFYLDKTLLPFAPGKLQIKIGNANKTVTLIDGGEVNLLKTPGLSDIEFECLLPQVQYPFSAYPSGFQNAQDYLGVFEKFKAEKKPFQFIIARSMPSGKVLFSTNMKVSLEDYTITEEAENGFDITVKIKLKQYRDFGTKTVNIQPAEQARQSDAPAATVETPRAESTVQAAKPITIGCDVIVNGRLHRDSYGNGPGQTRSNYRGKINFINLKGSHPYHVATPSGGWLGWVTAGSVQVV